MKICQRCDVERDDWMLSEARISIGGLDWKILLCRDCARTIQEVLRHALRSFSAVDPGTVSWGDKREKS